MPASNEGFADSIIKRKHHGLVSTVLCLEDAISDSQVKLAESVLKKQLLELKIALEDKAVDENDLPFIFIRVRDPEHLDHVAELVEESIGLLTGFVFPKFNYANGTEYLKILKRICEKTNQFLYGMPILESPEIIHWESRRHELERINEVIASHSDRILNIRIGATDFSGLFGVRRGHDYTVYDIHVIRDCITDIVNNFCRIGRDYVVSGPVWEYFWNDKRVLKPMLRQTPFREKYGDEGAEKRSNILNKYIDGLIYETLLDKTNGLVGKTVIHPSHILPVQSMYVVSHEDYVDALCILNKQNDEHGVLKSGYANKMNEIKPHRNWAEKIMLRAEIYGVFNENEDYLSLLE